MQGARHSAWLSLCLLPLLWLWPCVFGGRTFVPYDTAQFPPVSLLASPAELEAARDGANFDVTEVPPWFLPELILARDELLAGRLPTWNPHARGGAPLHAHGLIGLCYPPNWLALFAAEPKSRLGLVAWVNLALGGLLALGLLRALHVPLLAAWFGAVVFQLSAPMAVNAFFWMRLASFAWLPGVLWSALAVANADRWRTGPLAALAISFALVWLGGFPPFAITSSLLGCAFAAWLVLGRARTSGMAAAGATALRLLAGFALGGLLAAPQVVPSALFFPHSARTTNPSLVEIGQSAFESYGLLGYGLPDAFSHPGAQSETPYAQQNVLALLLTARHEATGQPALPNFNYTEYAVFVGTMGLLLAAVGALAGRGQHRAFALVVLLGCSGLALLVPGLHWLFHLPLVKNVVPMRWLAPATIFVAWLAALGLERLRTSSRRLPWILVGASTLLALGSGGTALLVTRNLDEYRPRAIAALAAKYAVSEQAVVEHVQAGAPAGTDRFALAGQRLARALRYAARWHGYAAALFLLFALLRSDRQRSWLVLAAAAITALQLGHHGSTVTRGSTCAMDVMTPVHEFLRQRAAAAAASGGFMIARGSRAPELPSQLPPGQLMAPGIRDLNFYTHFDGRSLQPLRALLGPLGDAICAKGYLERSLPDAAPAAAPVPSVFAHPLLDLLGVRFVLAVQPLANAGARAGPALAGPGGEFFVYERATALPRAFVVKRLAMHANDQEVIEALLAPDFAPREVGHALAADVPAVPVAPAATSTPREVRFRRDDATELELEVAAGSDPWLVLTDTFLPGWTATCDGRAVPIVRANHAYRAIALPPTACRVVFRYDAPGLRWGLWLALCGAAALLLSAFATWRTRARNAA